MANHAINRSLLHAWRVHPRSPLFAEHVVGAAAVRGSADHALLFGGKPIEAITVDDYRTSAAREARDAARKAGRIPLLAREIEGLEAMACPARERFYDLHGGPYLCERTAIWRTGSDERSGWRRARIDTMSSSLAVIVDYKTTKGAVDAQSCERRVAGLADLSGRLCRGSRDAST